MQDEKTLTNDESANDSATAGDESSRSDSSPSPRNEPTDYNNGDNLDAEFVKSVLGTGTSDDDADTPPDDADDTTGDNDEYQQLRDRNDDLNSRLRDAGRRESALEKELEELRNDPLRNLNISGNGEGESNDDLNKVIDAVSAISATHKKQREYDKAVARWEREGFTYDEAETLADKFFSNDVNERFEFNDLYRRGQELIRERELKTLQREQRRNLNGSQGSDRADDVESEESGTNYEAIAKNAIDKNIDPLDEEWGKGIIKAYGEAGYGQILASYTSQRRNS